MYITCPNCRTNFIALPEQIGQNGRKVKCSKCLHIWHYKPSGGGVSEDTPKFDEEVITPIHENTVYSPKQAFHWQSITSNSNLPVLVIPKKTNYNFITPLILAIIIIGLLLVTFAGDFQQRYLLHKTLSVKYLGVLENKDPFNTTIHYRISNNTKYSEEIPLILLQLIGTDDKIIDYYYLKPTYITLDQREYIDLATVFHGRQDDIKVVKIKLLKPVMEGLLKKL